jgi:hypothetical protein
MYRLVAAPHPFKTETIERTVPEGLTLLEMLELSQVDPVLRAHAHIWIGDQYVPRDRWRLVRPKAGATITLRVVPHGGDGGGKNILRTVLMIAVMVVAIWVTGGAAAGLLGAAFAAGTTGAVVLGAAVTIAGTLLINAIAPIRPPSMGDLSGTSTRDSPTLFIEGARNAVRPFGSVPSVLGVHRHVPPLGTQSYSEVVGDDHYLRMLVVWGYGPLKIEDIKIGETAITEFDGVQIETREGRAGDAPLTLIPDTVSEDAFSILLTQAADWQTRTAQPDADELSVDVTFPQGLVAFNSEGGRDIKNVTAQIQYREVGSGTWFTPAFTAFTTSTAWISGDTIVFSSNRTSAIRHGFRWAVPSRGDYEVRIRRTETDSTSTQIMDQLVWTALRSIKDEDPINFAFPVAKTALVIKATDQLNRAVDELNATVSSYVTSYTGGSPAWTEAVSSNPADLFRHVLQGNANARRLADARVDIDKLEEWHTFCAANGFEFNMIRDFQVSVWDTLADIAAVGRASPAQVDGKWSVVVDEEQTVPVQHFTPRNSSGFEAEKGFPDQPDAFRMRFANREQGWRQDERIVYADGFTSANAEDFDGLDAPGITDPEHVWKFARFQIAQAKLRPERWTFNVDFEHIVARRGDLVLVTHDVLLVGLASGRIKQVLTGGSPEMITGLVVDEVLTMEAGTDYGLSIRTVANAEVTKQIVTSAGDQTTVTFTAPFALSTVGVGDLFGFGQLGSETIEGLLLSIEPSTDLAARIVCIPASPAVYDADTGVIPAFDTKLTPQAGVPIANITSVRSDESVLHLGSGNTLVPHIAVSVVAVNDPNVSLDVQIRATGTDEPYYAADVVSVQGSDYLIGGVEQGRSYDLRARWRDPVRLPPAWTIVFNHRVVGQTNPPAALVNATISVFGGSALIRWDRPAELDVRFGGEVRFRHTPETDVTAAAWQSSTSIGTAAKGDALFASLPLKPGTYVARVFDKGGRPSDPVALSTKQASVLAFANVDSVTESPAYSGAHSGTVADAGTLKLSGTGLFDDIDDFDTLGDLDGFGGIATEGTYSFAGGFDLGVVTRVRLTSNVDAKSVFTLDRVDLRTANIDSWEDFDGTEQSAADCRVQVRHTDDEPAGSPIAWSVWNELDSAEFEARGYQFRAQLTTDDPAFNIRVDTLAVVAEEI